LGTPFWLRLTGLAGSAVVLRVVNAVTPWLS